MVRKGSRAPSRRVAIRADPVHPQPLLTQRHPRRLRRGHAASSATRADPRDAGVLGCHHRSLGQLDHLPGAPGPAPGQPITAVGTLLQHVIHPPRWAPYGFGPRLGGRPLRRVPGEAGFRSVAGCKPGIRPEPLDWARCSNRSMMACCRMMLPLRVSRSAVLRSISVSTPRTLHN